MEPSSLPKSDSLQTAYDTWSTQRTPANAGAFTRAANPIVSKVLTTLKNDSPGMRGRAKVLLVDSLPKYDPKKKVPLQNWIYGQLQPLKRENIRQGDVIPIPEVVRRQLAESDRVAKEMENNTGIRPDDLSLSDKLKMSPARLRKIRGYKQNVVSEQHYLNPEGDTELPGTQSMNPEALIFDYVYHDLNPADRRLVDMVNQQTPKQDIAKGLKITPAALSQRAAKIAARVEQLMAMHKEADGGEFGVVLLPIPEPYKSTFVNWTLEHVDPDDLYHDPEKPNSYGVEMDPHITLKYGLHTDDPEKVREVLKGLGPVTAELGSVGKFTRTDKPFDVIKVNVDDGKVFKINEVITDNLACTDTHPTYRPHVTLAYVKKGRGDELVGREFFSGMELSSRFTRFADSRQYQHDIIL